MQRIWQINDALLRTLDAEREGTPIAVEEGASAGAAPLLDLDGGNDDSLKGKVRGVIPELFYQVFYEVHQIFHIYLVGCHSKLRQMLHFCVGRIVNYGV